MDEARKEYELLAAVFVGGTEKIMEKVNFESLGLPVVFESDPVESIRNVLKELQPELLLDLSDEPVVDYRKRLFYANLALTVGASYVGADFRFHAPIFADVVKKPSLAIIGTGKRVGKTAISAYISREIELKGRYRVCVVAMGRGGPAEPEILEGEDIELTPSKLLKASRQGKHAASDYYEDALTSRITTIGCRRCGGGLAGAPFISNVVSGAKLANNLDVQLIIFEGSGATLPPVKTDAWIAVVGSYQPIEYIGGYFGPYRLIKSEMAVITGCEEPLADRKKVGALEKTIRQVNPEIKIVRTIFRPYPLESVSGEKVFLVTTAHPMISTVISDYLEQEFACEVVGVSTNLANRQELRKDLKSAKGKYEVLVTELKAAAVDVVTEIGLEEGVRVVYADNIPITTGGEGELSDLAVELAKRVIEKV